MCHSQFYVSMRDEKFADKNLRFFKKVNYAYFSIAFQQFMLALVSASDAVMLSQDTLLAVSLAVKKITLY